MTKTLSFKIPESLEKDLNELAKEQGVSKSEVVRAALENHCRSERPTSRNSALALADDLVGSLEGPEDLSSNPRHLEDLGS